MKKKEINFIFTIKPSETRTNPQEIVDDLVKRTVSRVLTQYKKKV